MRRVSLALSIFAASISLRQFGQYQGAGVFTGFGLRLRHLAQWSRLPLMAVLGRDFLPLLGKFFDIGTSVCGRKSLGLLDYDSNEPVNQHLSASTDAGNKFDILL
jgi:hypothetical protein